MGEVQVFDIPDYEPCPEVPDYHAVYSIKLCELVNDGLDVFEDKRFDDVDWYSEEQRERLHKKFNARFWYREIGITPPNEWMQEVYRLLLEVMPKYKPVYAAIENGLTPLAVTDTFGKDRRVYSDFPATQLNPETEDYARNADDRQFETVENGDLMKKMDAMSRYNDTDAAILEELEGCFSCLLTANVNAW